MSLKLKLALIASLHTLLISVAARADSHCWVDHIEKFEDGIKIVFDKNANINVQGIKRAGSTAIEQIKAGASLVLKAGDESSIYGGPHDSCLLKAEKKENKLGLSASYNSHIPGVPPTIINKFISPSR